jgi:two-component system, NtrC family, response regulator HupR/HoxA
MTALPRYPVLVVDDEPDILDVFALNYDRDFELRTARSGQEALAVLDREPIAVLVTDQRMPVMTGIELIGRARAVRPDVVPIVLTGYTDVEALVAAVNLNCIRRYVAKPFDVADMREAIRQALEAYHLARENARLAAENARLVADLAHANERLGHENRWLRQRDAACSGFEAIVHGSAAMRHVIERARRVADSPTTVLIEGPTGSGKELVARAIHEAGPRRERLFVPVNTGALGESLLATTLFGHRRGAFTGAVADQKGLFELADGGTLFLDEIGETSPAFQVALLRALQDGEILPVGAPRPLRVDVRVIAATNRSLDDEVRRGRFREDLLHRLRVFPLRLPSLAERREDIRALAEHLLERVALRVQHRPAGFTPEALGALERHAFTGNVRELENLIERALILCPPGEPIGVDDLFDRSGPVADGGPDGTLQTAVQRFEEEQIRRTLAACAGNKAETARRLGLTYRGLQMKMQRLGMPEAVAGDGRPPGSGVPGA